MSESKHHGESKPGDFGPKNIHITSGGDQWRRLETAVGHTIEPSIEGMLAAVESKCKELDFHEHPKAAKGDKGGLELLARCRGLLQSVINGITDENDRSHPSAGRQVAITMDPERVDVIRETIVLVEEATGAADSKAEVCFLCEKPLLATEEITDAVISRGSGKPGAKAHYREVHTTCRGAVLGNPQDQVTHTITRYEAFQAKTRAQKPTPKEK